MWDYFFHHVEGIAAFIAIVTACGTALWWLYKIVRYVQDSFTYVDELKTNHIPHLQRAIESIMRHLGITPED